MCRRIWKFLENSSEEFRAFSGIKTVRPLKDDGLVSRGEYCVLSSTLPLTTFIRLRPSFFTTQSGRHIVTHGTSDEAVYRS